MWQRRFGGAVDILGREIRVSGRARKVVGIMKPGFCLLLDYREERTTDLWMPVPVNPALNLPWGDRSYFIIGQLAPGATATGATAELERVLAGWERMGYVKNTGGKFTRAAVPLEDLLMRNVRPGLKILFGAVGFLLLIACANVAHLLLARSDTQRGEIATQAALGASRFRIVRQLLVESGMLAMLGAACGIGLARAGLVAALAIAPINVIRTKGVAFDLGVLGFTALLALGVTLAAGLAPALRLARIDIARSLGAGRGETTRMRGGMRRLLIITETALSLALVLGAVLLARSLTRLSRVDLGFHPHNVLTLRMDLPRADYPESGKVVNFYDGLLDRVRQLPRVQTAGAARILPLTGTIGNWSITIENRVPAKAENTNADWQVVTPGYMESLGIRLSKGRFLHASDSANAPMVAVINSTMAERFWPGDDVIGKRFHLGTANQPWVSIIGVTQDVRHNAVVEDARAEMYLPHAQWVRAKDGGSPQFGMSVVIRTLGDPMPLLPLVLEEVRRLDPALPVSEIRTYEAIAASALAQPRFTAGALGLFAVLALVLAATGLYGVTSFVTACRTHEIGLRAALGAQPNAIVRLVMRDSVIWAAIGIVLGLVGSLWIVRLLAGQLYGISSLDPVTFSVAPLILLAVAMLASFLPAHRAARAHPVAALKEE